MKLVKVSPICAAIAGILLVLTAFVHLVELSDTIIAIKTGDIAKAYEANIIIIWVFAGLCMALLGVWLLVLSKDLGNGSRSAWRQALLIGTSLLLFGLGSWLSFPKTIHVLYFAIVGLILVWPLLLQYKSFTASSPKGKGPSSTQNHN